MRYQKQVVVWSLCLLILLSPALSSANPFLATAGRFIVGWALGNSLNSFMNHFFGLDPGDIARVKQDVQSELRKLKSVDAGLQEKLGRIQEDLRFFRELHIMETAVYAEALGELGVYSVQRKEYKALLERLVSLDEIVSSKDQEGARAIYQQIRSLHNFDPQRIFSLEVAARLKAHQAQLKAHQSQLATHSLLLAEIDEQLQYHSTRLDALSNDVSNLQGKAVDHAHKIAQQGQDIRKNKAQLTQQQEEIKAHENFLVTLTSPSSTGDLLVMRAEDTSERSLQFGAYIQASLGAVLRAKNLTLATKPDAFNSPRQRYVLTYRVSCHELSLGGARCYGYLNLKTSDAGTLCTVRGLGRDEDVAFDQLRSKISQLNYTRLLDGEEISECI